VARLFHGRSNVSRQIDHALITSIDVHEGDQVDTGQERIANLDRKFAALPSDANQLSLLIAACRPMVFFPGVTPRINGRARG